MTKATLTRSTAMVLALAISVTAASPAFAGKKKDEDPNPGSGGGGNSTTLIHPHYGHIDPFYGDINPFYGDINPFYGDISPFWGDIQPFWGDINPFYGDIQPFWGDINPFYGHIDPFYGDINPFWGDIGPFWGDIGPFWGDIDAFWSEINAEGGDRAGYQRVAEGIERMFREAEALFGASFEGRTGESFRDAFMERLLDEHGIELDSPRSLAQMSGGERARFFLDFYDGLMAYSGVDHVDHWMPTINWSPALSQAAGQGEGVKIALIDFALSEDDVVYTRTRSGERVTDFGHGSAVAGLIGAPHDGTGTMGLAPLAKFMVFDPFDGSNTASWRDVEEGINRLVGSKPDIVNLSLGVAGWTLHPRWADIIGSGTLAKKAPDVLFVFAAGNDGSSQSVDINVNRRNIIDNILLVGSVGPTGEISRFSNRPGTACMTVRDRCQAGNRLMDRFLVAPGELLLVNDGNGGLVRQSGTSFAAPLVSGAAALVYSEWKWLTGPDVADVLLQSAQDLGAPGVDEVYGHGLLDVTAAMSPLDRSALYHIDAEGDRVYMADMGIVPGRLSFETPSENRVTVFEDLNDTYRDFEVSLDEVTHGGASARSQQSEAMIYLIDRTIDTGTSFTDTGEYAVLMDRSGALEVHMVASQRDPRDHVVDGALPFQTGIRMIDRDNGREFRFGAGEGAIALNGQAGFGQFSDHRPETGGVNPVLGFASGGAYALGGLPVAENTRVSFGVSANHSERTWSNPITGEQRDAIEGLGAYEAIAFLTDVHHSFSDRIEAHVSYTYLREDSAFLGAQGTGQLGFGGGSSTDAVTVGADALLPLGIDVSSSATLARTRTAAFDGGLLASRDGTISSALQISARRTGVIGEGDAIRVSLIQPLHVESGALEYTSGRVVDRETGAMAIQTDRWELGGERPLHFEVQYATGLWNDRASLALFSRTELSGDARQADAASLATGARFQLDF
ncbi:S8 family peptidase [Maricaulis sp. CAU 1757]